MSDISGVLFVPTHVCVILLTVVAVVSFGLGFFASYLANRGDR